MKTIIIDTNALMAVSEFGIDLFREIEKACLFSYQLAVLTGTIQELEKIKEEQRGKFKVAAKLGLLLVEKLKIKQIPSSELVDDELVKHSGQGDIVLTQDQELKKRLTKPYLTIRQKKWIVLVE